MDITNFPAGTSFIFGAWLCKVDNGRSLRSCLLENTGPMGELFPTGSTFIFDSWVDEADFFGEFQRCLLDDSANQQGMAETGSQFTSETTCNSTSNPIQLRLKAEFDSDCSNSPRRVRIGHQSRKEGFLFGLQNSAKAYQAVMKAPIKRVQLKGKQEGLVLTITPGNCIVHWPESVLVGGSTQLLEATTLPFQMGAPL